MKKLLSLSALILFSCSKDIIVPTDSGNKIIGNYQLIQKNLLGMELLPVLI